MLAAALNIKIIIYGGTWPGCSAANTDLLFRRLMLMMRLLIYLCENCAEKKKCYKKCEDGRGKERVGKNTKKTEESLGAAIDFSFS